MCLIANYKNKIVAYDLLVTWGLKGDFNFYLLQRFIINVLAVLSLYFCTQTFCYCSQWGLLCYRAQTSHCGGFSHCRAWASVVVRPGLWSTESVVVLHVESPQTGDGTHVSSIGRQTLNHWKESESEVAQLCPTLFDPMDCSQPGSSVHGFFQARVLEWVAISFFRGSSYPVIEPGSPALEADRCFTILSHQGNCLNSGQPGKSQI